jgi:hypothetical protein
MRSSGAVTVVYDKATSISEKNVIHCDRHKKALESAGRTASTNTKQLPWAYVCEKCKRDECARCGASWCRCVRDNYAKDGTQVSEYCSGCDTVNCVTCFGPSIPKIVNYVRATWKNTGRMIAIMMMTIMKTTTSGSE